jgi:ankyrin repeat protein
VSILLAHGADVNQPGPMQATPLIVAAQQGHAPIVEALLKAGANPSARAANNVNAILAATLGGHASCQALVRDALIALGPGALAEAAVSTISTAGGASSD